MLATLCAAVILAGCSTDEPRTTDAPAARTLSGDAVSPGRAGSASPRPEASAEVAKRPDPPASPTGSRGVDTGWGPTGAEIGRASRLASELSLAELAGQVIVARYAGTAAPTSLVNRLHLGGVITFDENIAGTDQIRDVNRTLQASAAEAGRRWPVFVGVDQEGGIVERVKGRATRFPTFMTAGAAADPELTRGASAASGAELNELGFTAVFAPVADVTSGPDDPTVGARSAGSRPRQVAAQVDAAVAGYLSSGVVPVVKHFPGHGSVPVDSHVGLPVQDKTLSQLARSDLVPFRSAVSAGAASVMVAHIDVRAVDAGRPATMSPEVVTGLLRKRLGFEGLVVTDALDMAAVTERFDSAEAAVRAIAAGNDVVLMPPDPRAARAGIVAAVRSERLPRGRLHQAATRQIAVLLHQRARDHSVAKTPGTSGADSRRLSEAGVSVVSGPCEGRLVGSSVQAVGPGDAVARFDEAAARAGLPTTGGTTVALVGYGGAAVTADVVVSMDTPYVLGRSTGRIARLATYGDTPGAMRALVRVLLGRARAPGRLPVDVAGVARSGCPTGTEESR